MSTCEVPIGEHLAVGPFPAYGHAVTLIGSEMAVCLDCGYCESDIAMFQRVECDREKNEIQETWRERIDRIGFHGE